VDIVDVREVGGVGGVVCVCVCVCVWYAKKQKSILECQKCTL